MASRSKHGGEDSGGRSKMKSSPRNETDRMDEEPGQHGAKKHGAKRDDHAIGNPMNTHKPKRRDE